MRRLRGAPPRNGESFLMSATLAWLRYRLEHVGIKGLAYPHHLLIQFPIVDHTNFLYQPELFALLYYKGETSAIVIVSVVLQNVVQSASPATYGGRTYHRLQHQLLSLLE